MGANAIFTCFTDTFGDYWTFTSNYIDGCGFTNTQTFGPKTDQSPLPAGASKTMQMYLRFGSIGVDPAKTTQAEMLAALNVAFPNTAASWTDRRPLANWVLGLRGSDQLGKSKGVFQLQEL